MVLALHQSWSFPLGILSTPATRWRARISLLSSDPLPYSHAGKSTLNKETKKLYIITNLLYDLGSNLGFYVIYWQIKL